MKNTDPMLYQMKKGLLAFILLVFSLTVTIISCRKEIPPPPSCGNCEQTGTIEMVPCASGAWGNLWIRTSNGKLLKPCHDFVQTVQVREGMKIRFSAVDPKSSECIEIGDPVNTCVRAPQADMVKDITCLQVDPNGGNTNSCTPIVIGDDPFPSANPFTIQSAKINGHCIDITVAFSGCSDKNRKFQLVWDGGYAKSIPPQVNLVLTDMGPAEMCQAAFIKTYSFDLSKIESHNPTTIHLAGYNQQLEY